MRVPADRGVLIVLESQLRPAQAGESSALVGLSVSFGVHAIAFGALIAGAWLAVGTIRIPEHRLRPPFPPLIVQDPAPAVAAPLPRSSSGSTRAPEQRPPDEPITEMVQPQTLPEKLPDVDLVDAGEDDEEFEGVEGGIPDGDFEGVLGGDRNGRRGGVPYGDPNGVPWGKPGGKGDSPWLPGQEEEVLTLDGEISAPVKLSSVQPEYPETARRSRLQGNVSLEVVVNREGLVERVRVLSGNEIFRVAAVEAVRQWRYRPALQSGRPVKVVISVIVEFRIR